MTEYKPKCPQCGKRLYGPYREVGLCARCSGATREQERQSRMRKAERNAKKKVERDAERRQAPLVANAAQAKAMGISYGEYMERKARSESDATD